MGGGGGGGDGGAAAREAARKSRVDSSVKAINALFLNPETGEITVPRQQALNDVESKVQQRFLPEFHKDTANAQRELKFAISRRGLSGGSAQSDASSRLRERVAETERDISQRALVARNDAERGQQNLLDNLIASLRLILFSYKALPIITPDILISFIPQRYLISSIEVTPPEAINGILEKLKIFEISKKFIPSNIPSLLTSVKTIS